MIHMRNLGCAAALAGALAIAAPASALDVQELKSPGGIPFWLVTEPSIPIVSVEIDFEGGARLDPDDRVGLSRFLMAMMDEGAGDMDSVGFAEARNLVSARYGFSGARETVSVSAQMLAETLDESVALLATAITQPRFDAAPMERVRGQLLSDIAESSTKPDRIASRAWFARAFPDHAYGRPRDGTADGVRAVTADDLRALHARQLTRSNAYVAIVGAIEAEAAGAMVDTLLGDLPAGEPIPPADPDSVPPPGLEIIELDVPQSVAIFGHAGLPREDPDFFAAYLMNHILGGGGFSSRLMEEVREKRGLAYGVYSYLSDLSGGPLYLGSVQTANARMAESIEVIRAEWVRMKAGDVDEDALDRAKKYLTGAFPLRFESNARIASFLVFAMREGLGADYIDRRNGLVEAVTLEDVKRVADRLLDPEALSITVVGQPAGL